MSRLPVTKSEYNKKLFDVFLEMFKHLKESVRNWKNQGGFLFIGDNDDILIAKTGDKYFAFKRNVDIQDWNEKEFSDLADKFLVVRDKKEFPNDDELNIISKVYKNENSFVVDERHEKVNKGTFDNPDWVLEKLSKSVPVMVYRFGRINDFDEFMLILLENNLMPSLKNTRDEDIFKRIVSILREYPEFLKIQVKSLKFNQQIFSDYLEENPAFSEMLKNSEDYSSMTSDEAYEMLLKCDNKRADLPVHLEEELTDANKGHWDLYADDNDVAEYIEIDKDGLIPRNPKDDVKLSGTVGIDFGTKSTVVVGWPGQGRSMPIPISTYSGDDFNKRYENPTVMEFVDIERFLNDYDSKKGRPDTKWADLTVSHTAAEQFIYNEEKERNASFLYQIKQWAGNLNKKQLIKTKDKKIYELKSFLDIEDGDLNPIEIYAYYIGLYINQMNSNVYLKYYLAFPVTYDFDVRNKVVESFAKGLKKSLPEAILNDENLMKRFKVIGTICEPSAYAVTALSEYGFKPKEDEKVRYAVFDFGGGTSDFDYGTWAKSDSERYSYVLDNYTKYADGVPTLGGENLLEDLASKIFKDNKELLLKNEDNEKYCFCFGSVQDRFLGWDIFIGEHPSQYAHKNMHNLIERLRPYWEESDKYQQVNLKKELEDMSNPNLDVDDEDLVMLISKIKEALQKCKEIYSADEFKKAENELEIIEKELSENEEDNKSTFKFIDKIVRRSDKNIKIRNNLRNFYRDFLEGKIVSDDSDNVTEEIKITAWSENGNPKTNFELKDVKKDDIFKFFEDKIRSGVKSFIIGLNKAFGFERKDESEKVNIFLAGNSCKSPIFRRIFKEEIKKFFKNEIKQNDDVALYEIFPPLGSDEAKVKMIARGITPLDDGPNGKTGVAYGLIKCGASGGTKTNKVARSEYLPWYIGKIRDEKFCCIGDETHRCKLNVWYKVRQIECDEDGSDIVSIGYTKNINAIQNNLNIEDPLVSWEEVSCNSDGATLFVKASNAHTIVCVVANTDDPNEVDSTKIAGTEKEINLIRQR